MTKQTVFLSHSSEDKPFVRKLDSLLQALSIRTFLDDRDIKVGEDIPGRIYEEIDAATHVVYVISRHSVASRWVVEELSISKMKEKERDGVFILPVLIDDVEVPTAVKSKRYADFRGITPMDLELSSPPMNDLLLGLGASPSHLVQASSQLEMTEEIGENSEPATIRLGKILT